MTEATPNPVPKGETCGTCRFAGTRVGSVLGPEKWTVTCHRFPPVRAFLNEEDDLFHLRKDTQWPYSTWDDWCGEWQPRREEAA